MTTPFDEPQGELAWMFLQSLCEDGDLDEGFSLLREDFTHWSILTGAVIDKPTLRRLTDQRKRVVEITLDLIRCVHEGDSVVVEAQADGVTAGGVRYNSPFVFLFETQDGLITAMREYSDTRLAARAFPDPVV